jgi:hypothetical protein
MARNDGIHRAVVRNAKISDGSVRKVQDHNEREKSTYSNQDIVPERSELNFHFKIPEDDYKKVFDKMVNNGEISVRGLRLDAVKFGELIFDVNSLYFYDHGGYDFAKRFYEEAYQVAIKIIGGEQYILSAVMHADECNRALSDSLGKNVFHYHLHVVYIPVVEKEICWSVRCKNTALIGTVKDRVMQVSMSKKWASKPALDDKGHLLMSATGKIIYKKSYSVLQDNFFDHMRVAGYTDVARGERGSSEEHLTITQFKVMKEQERLNELEQNYFVEKENFDRVMDDIRQKKLNLEQIDNIKTKPALLTNKITLDQNDFDLLLTVSKQHVVQEKKESSLKKALESANRLITELKNLISNLTQQLSEASKKLVEFKFIQKENRRLDAENDRLRAKIKAYDEVISNHNLSPYFHRECEKEESRDDDR